ncbi:hypothetical protein DSN97_10935 [Deferribacteraceae bacterium V6Fe1]|nr:hypothetical protein DSN97_10935 [Deferribacteraceae bacterium V6Fe1]
MKTEELKNHQAFKIVQQIRDRLSQEDANKLQIEHREFILDAISYFDLRVNISISSLINVSQLNQIQNYFQNSLTEINNFFVDGNYGHVNNALSHINNAISIINQFPLTIPQETKDLSDIVNNFRTIIQSEEDQIKKSIGDLKNQINPINNQLTQIQQNIANQQNQSIQLTQTFQNEFNKLKQKLTNDIEDATNKILQESSEINKKLNSKLEEAKKIVNIIGNIGVTGGYQKNAEYHKKQANLWRWIAIIIMLLSIAYLGYSVFTISQYEWHISLLRIISTALFIYPAQYAASQSSKHREQEFYNKKMELDLSAINPFIELFDDKKKQEIKEKLVEKYFNSNNLSINKTESDVPITIYEKIVNQFISIIKSIK